MVKRNADLNYHKVIKFKEYITYNLTFHFIVPVLLFTVCAYLNLYTCIHIREKLIIIYKHTDLCMYISIHVCTTYVHMYMYVYSNLCISKFSCLINMTACGWMLFCFELTCSLLASPLPPATHCELLDFSLFAASFVS